MLRRDVESRKHFGGDVIGLSEWVLGLAGAGCDLTINIYKSREYRIAHRLHRRMESLRSYHSAEHGTGATDSVLAYTCAPNMASIDTVGVSLRGLEDNPEGGQRSGCPGCTFLQRIG